MKVKLCPALCDLWTVTHQAPPSMGFSRQEYRSGVPFPSPGDLPDTGIEPRSPTLQADALTSALPGKHKWSITFKNCESLYTTSVTYNIIHQPYFSKYKQEKSGHFCPAWVSFPPLICLEISYLSFKMLTLLGIIPSNRSSLVCREWILILYSFCILRICLLLDTTIFVSICSFQAETQSYLCFHLLELVHLTESELHKYLLSRNELNIFFQER